MLYVPQLFDAGFVCALDRRTERRDRGLDHLADQGVSEPLFFARHQVMRVHLVHHRADAARGRACKRFGPQRSVLQGDEPLWSRAQIGGTGFFGAHREYKTVGEPRRQPLQDSGDIETRLSLDVQRPRHNDLGRFAFLDAMQRRSQGLIC